MKTVTIQVGVRPESIPNGHEPERFKFYADTIVNLVGGYGICSDGRCKSRYIQIRVPDWIEPSQKYYGELTKPGYPSKLGGDAPCFVTCIKRAEKESDYWGAVDQDALIDEALASGLLLWYPDNGSMVSIPVEVVKD